MKNYRIVSTANGNESFVIETDITTFGELLSILEEHFDNPYALACRCKETRVTYELDSALLPQHDATFYFTPKNTKGAAYSTSQIRELRTKINKLFDQIESGEIGGDNWRQGLEDYLNELEDYEGLL